MKARPLRKETTRVFITNVRDIADALGIESTPSEYVEICDELKGISLAGNITVRVTRPEPAS